MTNEALKEFKIKMIKRDIDSLISGQQAVDELKAKFDGVEEMDEAEFEGWQEAIRKTEEVIKPMKERVIQLINEVF